MPLPIAHLLTVWTACLGRARSWAVLRPLVTRPWAILAVSGLPTDKPFAPEPVTMYSRPVAGAYKVPAIKGLQPTDIIAFRQKCLELGGQGTHAPKGKTKTNTTSTSHGEEDWKGTLDKVGLVKWGQDNQAALRWLYGHVFGFEKTSLPEGEVDSGPE